MSQSQETIVISDDENEGQHDSLEPTTTPATDPAKSLKREATNSPELHPSKARRVASGHEASPSTWKDKMLGREATPADPKELRKKSGRAEDRINMLHGQNANLEAQLEEAQQQIEAYEAKQGKSKPAARTDKQFIKQATYEIKAEYRKKLDQMKQQFEGKVKDLKENQGEKIEEFKEKIANLKEKHEEELAAKNEAHKNKIAEIRGKAEEKEGEWKQAKADHAEELRILKANQQEFQKTLNSEKREEIRSWKPEHSQAVKDRDATLKEKEQEISELHAQNEKLTAKIGEMETTSRGHAIWNKNLSGLLEKSNYANDELNKFIRAREEDMKELVREQDKLNEAHQAEMVNQGKRWKLQYDKAEKFAGDLVQQQRINFVLRNGLDSKDKIIEKLKSELAKRSRSEGSEVVERAAEEKGGDWEKDSMMPETSHDS